MEVAEQLNPGTKSVNVAELLRKASLENIPQSGLVPANVFQLLASAYDAAEKLNRKAFLYIDLIARDVLADWIPPEAVGGKINGPSMECHSASTQTLTQMANALKSATSAPRYFRSVQQWSSSWQRYDVVAIATKHLSATAAWGHHATVMRVSEENRVSCNHHVALAVTYDELRRRNWQDRAGRCDADLDIEKECWKIDKDLLETARGRLDHVVSMAGMKGQSHKGLATGSNQDSRNLVHESALAKQSAAAEAAVKKAESVISRLDKAQNAQPNSQGASKIPMVIRSTPRP